ncbi:MAG: type IV secretion system protein [Sphingopyxis sp.]|uniref:type IV secretion system protein n=1 Tax=Sphingopyxis sp. TaxID=1908224 RepID=UPI003D811B4A
MACPTVAPGDPFLFGMLRAIDCHAQTIGASGYQALSSPLSTISLLTTGVLTIFVALFGYRMLVGQTPALRDLVIAIVKIGFVLMLVTSWPAYRTLIYDVVVRAPAELAAAIGTSAALPGTHSGLAGRLHGIDEQIVEFSRLGSADISALRQNAGSGELPRFDPVKDRETIATGRSVYLAATLAAFGAVRLVAGVLLAVGPLFLLFLLFQGTIGLFAGWVRGLVWAALGSLATTIGFGVQLALFDSWLAQLLTLRRAGAPAYQAPVELFVISLVFALLSLALLYAAGRVASGFRIPDAVHHAIAPSVYTQLAQGLAAPQATASQAIPAERNRATAIADAVTRTQRRETALQTASGEGGGGTSAPRGGSVSLGARDPSIGRTVPLGESYRSRTRGRVSARAQRRDARI